MKKSIIPITPAEYRYLDKDGLLESLLRTHFRGEEVFLPRSVRGGIEPATEVYAPLAKLYGLKQMSCVNGQRIISFTKDMVVAAICFAGNEVIAKKALCAGFAAINNSHFPDRTDGDEFVCVCIPAEGFCYFAHSLGFSDLVTMFEESIMCPKNIGYEKGVFGVVSPVERQILSKEGRQKLLYEWFRQTRERLSKSPWPV